MLDDTTVHGTLGRLDRPQWGPLLDLIGTDLAGSFMWMCVIELRDGSLLHAYKHVDTRRYLHLREDDGRAFAHAGRNRYQEISAHAAIDEAFVGWPELLLESDHAEAVHAALREAYARAGRRDQSEPGAV